MKLMALLLLCWTRNSLHAEYPSQWLSWMVDGYLTQFEEAVTEGGNLRLILIEDQMTIEDLAGTGVELENGHWGLYRLQFRGVYSTIWVHFLTQVVNDEPDTAIPPLPVEFAYYLRNSFDDGLLEKGGSMTVYLVDIWEQEGPGPRDNMSGEGGSTCRVEYDEPGSAQKLSEGVTLFSHSKGALGIEFRKSIQDRLRKAIITGLLSASFEE